MAKLKLAYNNGYARVGQLFELADKFFAQVIAPVPKGKAQLAEHKRWFESVGSNTAVVATIGAGKLVIGGSA